MYVKNLNPWRNDKQRGKNPVVTYSDVKHETMNYLIDGTERHNIFSN